MAASTALGSVIEVKSSINEYYGAWEGTDEDRIMSYYAENVMLQMPGALMEGKEALHDQFVRPFVTAFPGNRHLVKNMIFGPGVVVVEWSFEAQHKGPFAGHAATGARVKVPGCGVYEYDSAKRQITAARIYYDMGALSQIITDSLGDDRKEAEDALQSNERNVSLIANVIPTLIHVLRADGSVLYVNQAVLGYTGLTLEDVRKEDYLARVFHPEDVERLREERREALTRAVPFEREQCVLGKDGRYRWFLIRYNPLLDEQGRIDRWYVTAFDIEDRKRAEAQAEREQERLRLLVDLASRAISDVPLSEVMQATAKGARHVTRSDAAFVTLSHTQPDQFQLGAIDVPSAEEIVQDGALQAAQGTLHGHVFATSRLWTGTSDDARTLGVDRDPLLIGARLRSACAVPLVSRTRVFGVLVLGRREPRPYEQADITFLTQLSNQVAIVVDSALAHAELRELKIRLTHEKVDRDDEIPSELNFKDMVGQSAALRRVLQQAATVGPTGSTVLIYGETGTGKELIAHAIHDLSPRSANPFVKLNCAAIPTGLLESELFGHERGAFTGAIAQRVGRFEAANTGTIFLDEVGEIPVDLQTKLLRVLQEREFERLGSSRVIRTDARLIAATNRDLREAVERQQFRGDLFYRLNVFPIHLPPLRQRREDIPLLVRHFAGLFARRMGKVIDTVPSEIMDALTRYDWPGNVRELQNVIERAVILSSGPVLLVPIEDLRRSPVHPRDGAPQTLEEAERAHILKTLTETRWVLSGPRGAAARLGVNRSTLQFRMKKLGILRAPPAEAQAHYRSPCSG
jgi:formate hydrogenlyase transcriptional activator